MTASSYLTQKPRSPHEVAAKLENDADLIERATGVNPEFKAETVRELRARAKKLREGVR